MWMVLSIDDDDNDENKKKKGETRETTVMSKVKTQNNTLCTRAMRRGGRKIRIK